MPGLGGGGGKGGGERATSLSKGRGCSSYHIGVKKVVFWCSASKDPQRNFCSTFIKAILNRKKYNGR